MPEGEGQVICVASDDFSDVPSAIMDKRDQDRRHHQAFLSRLTRIRAVTSPMCRVPILLAWLEKERAK